MVCVDVFICNLDSKLCQAYQVRVTKIGVCMAVSSGVSFFKLFFTTLNLSDLIINSLNYYSWHRYLSNYILTTPNKNILAFFTYYVLTKLLFIM